MQHFHEAGVLGLTGWLSEVRWFLSSTKHTVLALHSDNQVSAPVSNTQGPLVFSRMPQWASNTVT